MRSRCYLEIHLSVPETPWLAGEAAMSSSLEVEAYLVSLPEAQNSWAGVCRSFPLCYEV